MHPSSHLGTLSLFRTFAFGFYNRFFHPLRHINGPILASITPWVQLYHGLKGDRHLWLHELHRKYGTHVRVAPNFVSVNSDRGLHDIYGHGKRLQKATFYNAFPAIKGVYNTHNAIDKTMHGRKRRVLSQAFSENALKGMEDVMLLHVRQLCAVLAGYDGNFESHDQKGNVKNMGDWFSYLSYDVMGELCFGKSFDMLISDSLRYKVGLVDRAANRHYVCGLWMPLDTWGLDQIFIRKLTRDRWNFIMNSRVEANERAKERTQIGRDAKKDFFYYLLNAKDPETGNGLSTPELWGESNVLMIAGSDTTSTTLAATLFYLVRRPEALAKLTAEIRSAFTEVEEIVTNSSLGELVYLKACIDEALRLAPAVPGAIPREVMDGGAVVDGVFLPAGTDCGTPTYSIHRQERYYREAGTYMPERWIENATCTAGASSWQTTKESIETARHAFCPFSIGPRGCIGKSMAFMEMRLTLARLVFLFDMSLADREGEVAGHLALTDHFTSAKNGPNVVFRRNALNTWNKLTMPSPLTVTFVQATALNAIANVLAQLIDQRNNKGPFTLNGLALVQFLIYGLIIVPPNFYWQRVLEARYPGFPSRAEYANLFSLRTLKSIFSPRVWISLFSKDESLPSHTDKVKEKDVRTPPSGLRCLAMKLLLDQTLTSVANIILFVALINLLKGESLPKVWELVVVDFKPIMGARLRYRPIVSVLMYTVIPVDRRVVFGSACGVIWGVYLSLYAAV
ncbi:unnamed protein product [Penicillium salamii]|uniref:Cytochrome P450 monooxygenase poxM n=1 Tax=Penicillium salamii TaxID=1612424 RepID=A0A9W4NZA8_9EURO|nr:unnamed protein product [Penicillium salamii]CAG7953052.1 unnamed protein product [Penicillium salamii]CAG8003689.1 unnamed protein product [Penicillium salamii]CAG8130154.1 unnamed protein product [Penicillium salamii]CAG8246138.1 unnamed protein product [Penicillium salamii]